MRRPRNAWLASLLMNLAFWFIGLRCAELREPALLFYWPSLLGGAALLWLTTGPGPLEVLSCLAFLVLSGGAVVGGWHPAVPYVFVTATWLWLRGAESRLGASHSGCVQAILRRLSCMGCLSVLLLLDLALRPGSFDLSQPFLACLSLAAVVDLGVKLPTLVCLTYQRKSTRVAPAAAKERKSAVSSRPPDEPVEDWAD